MKAKDVKVTCPFEYDNKRTGIILANNLRQGDECVVIEWDDDHTVQAMNVNDITIKDLSG